MVEKTASVVMVLTKQAPKEYLAHLKQLKISYIITGDEDINFELALTKLKEKYLICTRFAPIEYWKAY